MGYTHYWKSDKRISQQSFAKLVANFEQLADRCELAGWDGELGTRPEVSDSLISFNGRGDDAHETFTLASGQQKGFEFCKTARKPYDSIVVAMLCLLDLHCPGVFDISSDGTADEWSDGLRLARTVNPAASIPSGVAHC